MVVSVTDTFYRQFSLSHIKSQANLELALGYLTNNKTKRELRKTGYDLLRRRGGDGSRHVRYTDVGEGRTLFQAKRLRPAPTFLQYVFKHDMKTCAVLGNGFDASQPGETSAELLVRQK